LHRGQQEAGEKGKQPPAEKLPALEDAAELSNPEQAKAANSEVKPPNLGTGVLIKPEPPVEPGDPTTSEMQKALISLQQTLGLVLWDQKTFEELLVIDREGRVVASTFGGHTEKSALGLEYFEQGRKTTWVQPVFFSPITEQLTMVMATPIYDEYHQLIGVLAARLNLDAFFRLINDATGLGRTGETVVAKKIKNEVVFMAPTRHDAEAALNRKLAVGKGRGLEEAARGQSGHAFMADYRGVDTYSAWQHIPSLDWGLQVKIDAREAMAGVAAARDRSILIVLVIVGLVVVASFVASRALVTPLRELKEATDRISRGDFAVQLNIRSNDEIGDLADSFERMVAAIKFFREHSRPADDDDVDEEAELERAAANRSRPGDLT
jgi:HAMP domain-containing protein